MKAFSRTGPHCISAAHLAVPRRRLVLCCVLAGLGGIHPGTIPETLAQRAPSEPANLAGANFQLWETVAGESPATLAQALYPKDGSTRTRFISALISANPELFPAGTDMTLPLPAGTRLRVPELRNLPVVQPPSTTVPRAHGASAASRSVADITPRPEPSDTVPSPRHPALQSRSGADAGSGDSADKLVLQGEAASTSDANDAAIALLPAAGGGDIGRREARLTAALDRTIHTQLELQARIRRLEDIQAQLRAQIEGGHFGTAPAATTAAIAATTPAAQASSAAAARAAVPTRPDDSIPERPSLPTTDKALADTDDAVWPQPLMLWLALPLLLLLAALWYRLRRRQARTVAALPPDTKAASGPLRERDADAHGDLTEMATMVPSSTASPRPDRHPYNPLEWDGVGRPPLGAELDVAPLLVREEIVEEHDSAIELADIMMSFGRLHGAAETLADFIRSNPKQAVTPWLKLMEVYRAAGLRPEFDALARQLNKTFNVKAVTWENFDAARAATQTLEQMPHVMTQLKECWGTREGQAYLEHLLRDNRDGTRDGFPLSVIDDIIMLTGVLEQQLGRYQPQPASENAAASQPA